MRRVERTEGDDGSVTYRLRAEDPAAGRLDRYLAHNLPLSRSQIAALIDEGRVLIGGEIPKKSQTPETGDEIIVVVPAPEPTTAEAQDIPIEVLHEDDWLAVVNKPAGLVVHPAPGHATGTLVNALLHRLGRLSSLGGERRPGIVHRLDKDTSGLMIVAKEERTHRRLSEALARREITRRYLAASWGHLGEDRLSIEADLGRHRRDRKRMAVVPGTRPAVTEIERLERWRAADYLRVRLHTGRTHQIRVHLHHIGHPVVGDRQYGAGWERGLEGGWPKELARRVHRQFLHAAELTFRHPVTDRVHHHETPLPEDLAEAARWARGTS